jgi:ATP-dependent 26S proteasome regulatory subunit
LQDAMNPQVELESLGLTAPTGILLYGPPGTGTLFWLLLWREKTVMHVCFLLLGDT